MPMQAGRRSPCRHAAEAFSGAATGSEAAAAAATTRPRSHRREEEEHERDGCWCWRLLSGVRRCTVSEADQESAGEQTPEKNSKSSCCILGRRMFVFFLLIVNQTTAFTRCSRSRCPRSFVKCRSWFFCFLLSVRERHKNVVIKKPKWKIKS